MPAGGDARLGTSLTLWCRPCGVSGSLLNLAKHPASTVQILGAEKALFRALKTRKDTPKYGLIYHASLVGQTAAKNKGKVRSGATAQQRSRDNHCLFLFLSLF